MRLFSKYNVEMFAIRFALPELIVGITIGIIIGMILS